MATAPTFVGQRVRVEVKMLLAGVPTDPTIAKCLVRKPSGSTVTLNYPDDEFTRRDIGLFEANVLVDEAGVWYFRGEAAGVVDGVSETFVTVQASIFA